MVPLNRRAYEGLVADIIRQNLAPAAFQWLEENAAAIRTENKSTQLNAAFAALPRKTGKNVVHLTVTEKHQLEQVGNGHSIGGWTIDRLARLWLLMQVDPADREAYLTKIENLFRSAEMNEGVALYSSLYLLEHPEAWRMRAAEGIRSNIGTILEAIMYENPYPSLYLDEPQWNQLVLKAFFTEKDVNRIIGLDERANKELASILVDYAHERWAARRTVDPRLWRLVGRFIDAPVFQDIQKLISTGNPLEKKAAGLACFQSSYMPAQELLKDYPDLATAIKERKITWTTL